MNIDIFALLVERLAAAKQAKGEKESLALADFVAVVVQLKADLPELLIREIRGSRLFKRDAQKQSELVLQFYQLTRGMEIEHKRELESTRQTALAERRIVYLPMMKNLEEP